MQNSIIDFITSSAEARNYKSLDLLLTKAIHNLGFSRFGYLARSLDGIKRDEPSIVRHTYPSSWVEYYMQNEYYLYDPVAIKGEQTIIPFEWGGKSYLKTLSKKQFDVFSQAAEFSIRFGYTIPIHGKGAESATMNIACEQRHRDFSQLVNQYRHELHIIALYYHQKVKELFLSKKENHLHLTNRESEVLHWAAQGKTFAEIATILSISRNTVLFHVQNAKRKLGAKSLNHATTIAIQTSLITP